jgi:predicted Fe-Mo cluster-binding NifX family protein
MKICMPTEDEKGLDSVLAGHFGSAPCLTILDTSTGRAEVVTRGGADHGACVPASIAASAMVDAVVCAGMGRKALAALEGIPVYLAASAPVRDVLAELEAGRLQRLDVSGACAGDHGACH